MRINRFIASATGLSRRSADLLVSQNRVQVNGQPAKTGQDVTDQDYVALDQKILKLPQTLTIMLNKPTSYVCSRDGQGSKTIYDLLPKAYHDLKAIGRLDKNSSGLLLLTSDGNLANKLTHPKYQKTKTYQVNLDKPLSKKHKQIIETPGVELSDGISRMRLVMEGRSGNRWLVSINEGRNRQIRRTFETLGYQIRKLRRIEFGEYSLGNLLEGKYIVL